MNGIDREIPSLARNWWVLVVRGAAAIIFGVLTFVLPGASLAALVLLFGGYALVDGVFSLVASLRRRDGARPWWALLLHGIAGIAAGVVTFMYPGLTALVLVYVIAAWAVITGVLEIVVAIRLRKLITGEWWLAASGALSIVFGALIMAAPGAGALALVLWIGAWALVTGVLLVAVGIRLRRWREAPRVRMSQAAA